jgi:hypothetical protein
MANNIFAFVPENTSGKPVTLQAEKNEVNIADASNTFRRACKRLLNFPVWNELCGFASATFELCDDSGKHLERLGTIGDLVRIDIPGPGTISGHGYDWVKIENLINETDASAASEHFLLQLRPCPSPDSHGDAPSHFFTDKSTSTFIIERNGTTVIAHYFGRNEQPNSGAENMVDKARNTFVALGAFAGLSALQWGSLIKGLLADEIGGKL